MLPTTENKLYNSIMDSNQLSYMLNSTSQNSRSNEVELEPLSSSSNVSIDYDYTIFQALVHEGKHTRVLNALRPPIQYNEKELRDAAHAVVAQCNGMSVEVDKLTRKRKHLDADEKAQQNRYRNREHAKNTRLRKKAYVMKLKELVDQINKQKESEEKDRKVLGDRIYDSQTIRKNVVRQMLLFRSSNVRDYAQWSSILDENVTFTLPITPYRSFHKSDIKNNNRVLIGIDAFMADCASLSIMLESIGQGSLQWTNAMKNGRGCKLNYIIAKDDILAAGDLVMCRYLMKVEGLERVGAMSSCVQPGMVMTRFDRNHKIASIEMMFDVMGYMQQLQRCSGISPECSIVPNTLDMALQFTQKAQAIVKATAPYYVLYVNEAWTHLNSFTQSKAQGRPLASVLRTYEFQMDVINKLASDCSKGSPGSSMVMVHDWKNEDSGDVEKSAMLISEKNPPQVFYFKLLPLTSEGEQVTHLLAVIADLPLTTQESESLGNKPEKNSEENILNLHHASSLLPSNAVSNMLPSSHGSSRANNMASNNFHNQYSLQHNGNTMVDNNSGRDGMMMYSANFANPPANQYQQMHNQHEFFFPAQNPSLNLPNAAYISEDFNRSGGHIHLHNPEMKQNNNNAWSMSSYSISGFTSLASNISNPMYNHQNGTALGSLLSNHNSNTMSNGFHDNNSFGGSSVTSSIHSTPELNGMKFTTNQLSAIIQQAQNNGNSLHVNSEDSSNSASDGLDVPKSSNKNQVSNKSRASARTTKANPTRGKKK